MAEDPKERVDRELIELLNELRVALPGVQVLFAFLLIVPFQQGFDRTDSLDRAVYFAALLSSAAGSALLIAPSAYHRLHFRLGQKERLLRTSNKLVIGGLALILVGVACSIFLIADVLFGRTVALVTGLITAAFFVLFWFVIPLARRRDAQQDTQVTGGEPEADSGG